MTAITTVLPELRRLAAAHRAELEQGWEEQRLERERVERQEAVDFANEYVQQAFPFTLAKVLPASAWVGYPAGDEDESGTHAAAVTHLGEGLFLHCTREQVTADEWQAVLTLLVPCVCGDYREAQPLDDYSLAWELEYCDANRNVCVGVSFGEEL
ncbi:hypothetical protein [Streptomyces violascens]|uniref:hypothetical protein n=1 Tax=Streptomyces violascens TaxID=67381 RepID=UPI00369E5A93